MNDWNFMNAALINDGAPFHPLEGSLRGAQPGFAK